MTLKQAIERIERFATSHRQINDFYFAPSPKMMQTGGVKYPACFLNVNNGNISRGQKGTTWQFEIIFADLANTATRSRENIIDVYSDLTSIAEDFKALAGWHEYRDWQVGDISNLQYLEERFEDVVYGVKMQLNITNIFDSDYCQVPLRNSLTPGEFVIPINRFMKIADFFVGPGAPMVQGSTTYQNDLMAVTPFVLIDGLLQTYEVRTDRRYITWNQAARSITINNGGVNENENIIVFI